MRRYTDVARYSPRSVSKLLSCARIGGLSYARSALASLTAECDSVQLPGPRHAHLFGVLREAIKCGQLRVVSWLLSAERKLLESIPESWNDLFSRMCVIPDAYGNVMPLHDLERAEQALQFATACSERPERSVRRMLAVKTHPIIANKIIAAASSLHSAAHL